MPRWGDDDIVEKVAATVAETGKRAKQLLADPLHEQGVAERQKWESTNRKQHNAIIEMYVRELGTAVSELQYSQFQTQSAIPVIFQPEYLAAVKKFRNSRQFKNQMQPIIRPVQIDVVKFQLF